MATLAPYVAPGELPQVFNFELVTARWTAPAIRAAIDATHAFTDGSHAPWVIGNHDVVRPVTRWGSAAARAAALLLLALPGSAYIYQGEELGLPEVTDIPDAARQDPTFHRTQGKVKGRDGCRVPLPWEEGGSRLASPERILAPRPPHHGCPSPPAGASAASPPSPATRPPSWPSTAALRIRRRHPPSARAQTAATRCAGSTKG